MDHGENRLIYIPDSHENGYDSIEFAVNDCPFDRFRSSELAKISIFIEPVDDPPIAIDFTVIHNTKQVRVHP